MKILVISNLYPPYDIGGYEILCRDTVEHMKRQGHKVIVLTSYYGLNSPNEDGDVLRLLEQQWSPGYKEGHWLLSLLSKHRDVKAFERIVFEQRPDLLLVFSMNGLPVQLFSAVSKCPVPKVFKVCDKWIVSYKKEISRLLQKFTEQGSHKGKYFLRRILGHFVNYRIGVNWGEFASGRMAFVSEYLRNSYAENGISVYNCPIIYNPVDTKVFQPNGTKKMKKKLKILYVSQLLPHKGAHVVLEALTKLIEKKNDINVTLNIVGTSENTKYLKLLKKIASEHNIEKNIVWHGKVEKKELVNFYHNNDIFVFPVIWDEPFALTLIEAMSSGIAVISTATGGSREILRDRENCLVFPASDATSLSERIVELARNSDLSRKIAHNASEMVRREFCVNKIMDASEEFYLREEGA
ncbi:MAG: glycosyltransferase family 4 protein [Candidatus Omnitrophica bacterium]|nr:glycosyltransferase family 4 protein [Candidatus Omnitrophota bacterium]